MLKVDLLLLILRVKLYMQKILVFFYFLKMLRAINIAKKRITSISLATFNPAIIITDVAKKKK